MDVSKILHRVIIASELRLGEQRGEKVAAAVRPTPDFDDVAVGADTRGFRPAGGAACAGRLDGHPDGARVADRLADLDEANAEETVA